jgi:Rieske Fe-S protein
MVKRRKVLAGLLTGGLGDLRHRGPLSFPAEPRPTCRRAPSSTPTGARAPTQSTAPVGACSVGDLAVGSIVTVYPEGLENSDRGQAVDQTVLVRISNENFTTQKGRETWGPMGYLAYSKVCTHLGCPVGLYEQELQLLVCPCHQSMFNVTNGAIPQFGPAPRPLPQLPLYVDSSWLHPRARRLRPAGGPWILGAHDHMSDVTDSHEHQARQAGAEGSLRPPRHGARTSSTIAWASPKGGRTFMDKIFPDHWSFMLGEIALYSFVVLLVTGVFLTFYFVPSSRPSSSYHGSYLPLDGHARDRGLRVDGQHLVQAVRGGLC